MLLGDRINQEAAELLFWFLKINNAGVQELWHSIQISKNKYNKTLVISYQYFAKL